MHPEDLIVFTLSRARDPDGTKLRRALHAHIAWGEARTAREWLLRVVVAVSLIVWVVASWPVSVPHALRNLALQIWAAGFIALFVAVTVEWWCRRLRRRYLEDLTPRVRGSEAQVL